jgi:predicted PP-loop superfamily ATPase
VGCDPSVQLLSYISEGHPLGELENKQKRLEGELKKLPSLIVAYSGGVDSA